MRKFIKGLLIGLCCLCMNTQAQISGQCGDNITFEFNETTGVLKLEGTGSTWEMPNKEIQPWNLFRSSIKKIVVEEGITSLGYNTFAELIYLSEAILPASLETIGAGVFQYTWSLKSITIPPNVYYIGAFAFASAEPPPSKLEEIINLNKTPQLMYENGGKTCLKDIVLSKAKLKVPKESLELYKSADGWKDFGTIEGIDAGMCGDNAYWEYKDSTLRMWGAGSLWDMSHDGGSQPWISLRDQIKHVIIEEGITSLGTDCFDRFGKLESVTLPQSLISIGICAFAFCHSLKSLILPKNLSYIAPAAFYECYSLNKITNLNTVPQAMQEYSGKGTFASFNPNNALLLVPESSVNAYKSADGWKDFKSIRSIGSQCGDDAYWELDKDTLTVEGKGAIWNMGYEGAGQPWEHLRENIKVIKIGEGIHTIGGNTFNYTSASSVELPQSLRTIGASAFGWMFNLKTFTLPPNVEELGAGILYADTLLEVLYSKNPIPPRAFESAIGTFWQINTDSIIVIVPPGSVSEYKQAEGWREFKKIIRDTVHNVNLKSLAAAEIPELEFDSSVVDYHVTVGWDISKLSITAIAEDSTALVKLSSQTINVGDNTIIITVTAEDESVKEYYLHIYRKNGETRLKSIKINKGTLEPGFTRDTKKYIWRAKKKDKLQLVYEAMDDKTSVSESEPTFYNTDTTFIIKTTAEDERFTGEYEITLLLYNSDATLKSLNVKDFELEPLFEPGITKYNIHVPDDVKEIYIEATSNDSNAIVKGHLGWRFITGSEMIFSIDVEADDREANKSYYIHLTNEAVKTAIKQANLSDEEVKVYSIDGKFLGTSKTENGKVVVPNRLGHGVFIAKGSKYREKFTN